MPEGLGDFISRLKEGDYNKHELTTEYTTCTVDGDLHEKFVFDDIPIDLMVLGDYDISRPDTRTFSRGPINVEVQEKIDSKVDLAPTKDMILWTMAELWAESDRLGTHPGARGQKRWKRILKESHKKLWQEKSMRDILLQRIATSTPDENFRNILQEANDAYKRLWTSQKDLYHEHDRNLIASSDPDILTNVSEGTLWVRLDRNRKLIAMVIQQGLQKLLEQDEVNDIIRAFNAFSELNPPSSRCDPVLHPMAHGWIEKNPHFGRTKDTPAEDRSKKYCGVSHFGSWKLKGHPYWSTMYCKDMLFTSETSSLVEFQERMFRGPFGRQTDCIMECFECVDRIQLEGCMELLSWTAPHLRTVPHEFAHLRKVIYNMPTDSHTHKSSVPGELTWLTSVGDYESRSSAHSFRYESH